MDATCVQCVVAWGAINIMDHSGDLVRPELVDDPA